MDALMNAVPSVPESPLLPVTVSLAYVVGWWIFSPRKKGPAREASRVNRNIALAHNLGLSCVSAVVVVLALVDVYKASFRYGGAGRRRGLPGESLVDLLCDEQDQTLSTNYGAAAKRIYHYLKYWELADTAILILQGKRPIPLHVYHHAVMIPLTWAWNAYTLNVQWWAVVVNSIVHVLMYYYYGLALTGRKVWWKRYITGLQLAQFGSVFFVLVAFFWRSIQHYALAIHISSSRSYGLLPMVQTSVKVRSVCTGDLRVAMASMAVNLSFLYLFAKFYQNTYSERTSKKKRQ